MLATYKDYKSPSRIIPPLPHNQLLFLQAALHLDKPKICDNRRVPITFMSFQRALTRLHSLLLAISIAASFIVLSASAHAAVKAYVTNSDGDSISVIDTGTDAVTATVNVGDAPYGVATSGTGIYVTNEAGGTVTVLDSTDNGFVKTVTVGSFPVGIVIRGTGAYVMNYLDDTISMIDITTNTVEKTITVGDGPQGVAVSGTGIYVTNSSAGTVSVIDAVRNTVAKTVTVGGDPLGITTSGTGAFVANSATDNITVIDTTDNVVVRTITVGDGPQDVAVSGTGAYVPNYISDNLSLIDITTFTVEKTIALGDGPRQIAIRDRKAYVPNDSDNNVSVINLTTNTVTTSISVGARPYDIALSPDTSTDTPTLTAPVTGASVTQSLHVTYTLPETPLAGTVRLVFAGSTTITLIFNNSTTGDFTVDLSAIALSSTITAATASSVPVGTYSVTLSYQDYLGNVAASTTSTSVAISAVPAVSSGGGGGAAWLAALRQQNGLSAQGQAISSSASSVSSSTSSLSTPSSNVSSSSASLQTMSSSEHSAAFEKSEITSSSSSASAYFSDVPLSAWFYTSIESLREKNVIVGYRDKNGNDMHVFGPADPVTFEQLGILIKRLTAMDISFDQKPIALASRGAVIHFVLQAYGISLGAAPKSSFSDLPDSHLFAKDILTALALGIISGDAGVKTVRPDAPVNRAETAKILAYISSRFTPVTQSTSASSSAHPAASVSTGKDIRTVASTILNVRSDSRINASILWVAKQGTEMEVLNIVARDWARIRMADGREGFVWVKYLQD